MKMPQLFRKEISIKPKRIKINHSNDFLLLGSCFTQNIRKHLSFNGYGNFYPFGTLYNPMTIVNNLKRIIDNHQFNDTDIIKSNGLYYCWNHSGLYSSKNEKELLDQINSEVSRLNKQISENTVVIITLGTSFVYEHESYGLVGNCHKISGSEFSKRFLKFDEMVSSWKEVIARLKSKHVIFTVSPVRHWSDGAVQNNRSKSLLHLLVGELEGSFENVSYFPSYEIMMDELRDYRFYKKDMLHPSDEAIEFIWNKFKTYCFSNDSIQTIDLVEDIRKAILHVPFNPNSKQHIIFLENLLDRIKNVIDKTPNYNWDLEIEEIKKMIAAAN